MRSEHRQMTVGSLFAGIGGFDLGFERAGFEIKWQVEIDDYCQRVLAKHWPHVRRYGDIRAIDWATVEPVDVVCGGFPCQPHSLAGKRGGSSDERDLWPEFKRCIRAVRPGWVVAENVTGLLSNDAGRFFGGVLGDLASIGYDAEWDCLPAVAFGAHHERDRAWIVAYPNAESRRMEGQRLSAEGRQIMAHANRLRTVVADAECEPAKRRGDGPQWGQRGSSEAARIGWERAGVIDGGWLPEPNVGRVAHGVPARVDRLRGLGNAVVPQIPEWIAHRIKEAEGLNA